MGCGASTDHNRRSRPAPAPRAGPAPAVVHASPPAPALAQMSAKDRFIESSGCVIQCEEHNNVATSALIAYCQPRTENLCVSYYDIVTATLYYVHLTDDLLAAEKQRCRVTYGSGAFFKSLAKELTQRTVVVNVSAGSTVRVEFNVKSVSDPTVQTMALTLASLDTRKYFEQCVVAPLERGASMDPDIAAVLRQIRGERPRGGAAADGVAVATLEVYPGVLHGDAQQEQRHVPPTSTGEWQPAMTVDESSAEFRVLVDLPGVAKQDVAVNVTPRQIIIRGTRPLAPTFDGGYRLVGERVDGTFERCFSLPSRVRDSGLTASFNDGVLQLVLVKEATGALKKSHSALGGNVDIV